MHPLIQKEETFQRFGVDPETTPAYKMPGYMVKCQFCHNVRKMSYKSFKNYLRSPSYCYSCPEYKKSRSDIAKKSNQGRKIRHKLYEPYLEGIRKGKLTFTEIAKELGKDGSTVCKFFHRHFKAKSRFGNKSLQEDEIYMSLKKIFSDCQRQVNYPGFRQRADFWIPSIGFIEYDGSGFYHILKKTDQDIDKRFCPIRLNAQAIFGGLDYLNYKLLNQKAGYCAAAAQEYQVISLNRVSTANDILENCHPLRSTSGRICFGLYFQEKLIGVAKFEGFGVNCLELKRLFVLDGTPDAAKELFLSKCQSLIGSQVQLTTNIYESEDCSYLINLGWELQPETKIDRNFYSINNKLYTRRSILGWIKKTKAVTWTKNADQEEILSSFLRDKDVRYVTLLQFRKTL